MLSLGCYTTFFRMHHSQLMTLDKSPGPHADGIVGSTNVKSTDSLTSHLKELSLNQSARGPASSVSSNPTQSTNVHSVQSSANPNVTRNQAGIRRKDVIIILRVGKIIINPRTMVIMRRQIIMLEREKRKT
jgi:hypothetical protein